MVFINLEKAYDSVPRNVIWNNLMARGLICRYIEVSRDMYDSLGQF